MKKNILNNNDFFQTSDLTLCAILLYFGFIIEAIDRKNSPKSTFLFKRDADLDKIIQGFWARQLLVEPAGFFGFLKEVKSRIYNQK